jgi:NodT family efflux transporter outer membrane factor (OMF) lipoprotein
VGPDFKPPQTTVTSRWRASGDPRIATQVAADALWWRSFNDPILDRLVDLAYRQNLSLQIAGLRILEGRAQFGVVTGEQFPQLQQLFGSAAAVGLSENAPHLATPARFYSDYRLGFDAIWEADFWGKYRRAVEAEGAGLLASVADYYSAVVSLTAEIARTYVAMRTFEVLIALARENVRNQEQALAIATSRFSNGATSELDVTQATTLLESTRASIPLQQIGLQQARNALSTLLGQLPGTVDTLLVGPAEIPKPPAKVAVSMPAEMLRRRPDVRGAELTAAAQCARIGVAKAELFPSFSLFGTVGIQTSSASANSSGAGTPNIFSASSIFFAVGPRLVFPFFNYGRIENNVRVEDARFQQLLIAYRDTVLKAVREAEDAMAGFINAQDAAVFEQGAVKAAQRSVELAMVQYKEGAADYQRVLDSQRSLLQQQNNFAQTSSNTVTNLIALYKALGGGWEMRQGQPVLPVETQTEMKQRTNWGDVLTEPRPPETATNPPGGKP